VPAGHGSQWFYAFCAAPSASGRAYALGIYCERGYVARKDILRFFALTIVRLMPAAEFFLVWNDVGPYADRRRHPQRDQCVARLPCAVPLVNDGPGDGKPIQRSSV
jgi:hypothetical protein